MHKKSLKLAVFFVLLTLAASSALIGHNATPALAGNPTVSLYSPSLNCNAVVFNHGARGTAQVNIYVPSGYTVKEHIVDIWGAYWTSISGQSYHEYNYTWSGPFNRTQAINYWIDIDGGSLYHSLEMYAPGGLLVSSTEVSMGCPGGVSSHGGDIYGPMPPDPDSRVMGTMLVDSPVYSDPNPNAALSDTLLKAGQTWFAVKQVTGTDGNKWYEIFVGGWNNGYVPASAMSLAGSLEEEDETVSPQPTAVPAAGGSGPSGSKSGNAGGVH